MKFSLYRYEFEVMEKKDFPASTSPGRRDELAPREAFERKGRLLDSLLERDCGLPATGHDAPSAGDGGAEAPLRFADGRKRPILHRYVTAPRDGVAILQLALCPTREEAAGEEACRPLHVIIDNRGTHQRVAIEVKPSVLSAGKVAGVLARALSGAFARYGLRVKVVPLRDDRHFWRVVADRERYPRGFRRLRVEFPQINDEELTERMRRAGMAYRELFGSGLTLTMEAPQGESLGFDREDPGQQEYMRICTGNADAISLSPVGGRSFKLGGGTARTEQMSRQQEAGIGKGGPQQPPSGDDPARQAAISFMDKAYGLAWRRRRRT